MLFLPEVKGGTLERSLGVSAGRETGILFFSRMA